MKAEKGYKHNKHEHIYTKIVIKEVSHKLILRFLSIVRVLFKLGLSFRKCPPIS